MARTTLAVDVAADADRVFEILSTTEGQRGFWTADCDVSGDRARFGFAQAPVDLEVDVTTEPAKLVRMQVTSGFPFWEGSTGSGSSARPAGPRPAPASCSATTGSPTAIPRPTSATPRRPGRWSWTGWPSTPTPARRSRCSPRPARTPAAREGARVAVDVRPIVLVRRPRPEVAAFMFDPANDLRWTGGITSSRPDQPGRLREGATVVRTARFLGRTFDYGYVVTRARSGPARRDARRATVPDAW